MIAFWIAGFVRISSSIAWLNSSFCSLVILTTSKHRSLHGGARTFYRTAFATWTTARSANDCVVFDGRTAGSIAEHLSRIVAAAAAPTDTISPTLRA